MVLLAAASVYLLARNPDVPDNDELQRYVRWTRDFLLLFVLLGAFSMLAYCLHHLYSDPPSRQFFGSLGAGLLLGLASLTSGGVVGFLFGVPRALRRQEADRAANNTASSASSGSAAGRAAEADRVDSSNRVNTNLEEISDWLTKIIVGIGLTQLMNLPKYIQDLTYFATPACTPNCVYFSTGTAFTIMALFSSTGFLLGYLLTRLFLQRPFAIAGDVDRKLAGALRAAEKEADRPTARGAAETARQTAVEPPVTPSELERAKRLQNLRIGSDKVKGELDRLADEYETLRATMHPGHERTSAMEQIAAQMKALALSVPDDLLRVMMASDSAGRRLAAVMCLQVRPQAEHIEWLASRLSIERPFVGYHAAKALRSAARALDKTHLPQLREAVQRAMGSVPEGTDRHWELKAALEDIQQVLPADR
jgi:hypothetical protein